jgi:hypothetical protein
VDATERKHRELATRDHVIIEKLSPCGEIEDGFMKDRKIRVIWKETGESGNLIFVSRIELSSMASQGKILG